MTRRLRLALLMAALVVAGPMPSVRAVDAARVDVGIAWFSGGRIVSPRRQLSGATIHAAAVERGGFHAQAAPTLSPVRLPHSLFQRPPPLQN